MDFHLHGLAVRFAALGKPRRERFRQTLRLNAKASLKLALSRRKRVIELSRACEIAHREAIKPIERAGAALTTNNDFNFELARVHFGPKYSIGKAAAWITRECFLPAHLSVLHLAFPAPVP